ncbi:hypothetical protein BSN85_35135 [Bradyrhizobium brasilense]|nr:hypothetical protein BSN85_35135 [Bradyrhizobium brasilense]
MMPANATAGDVVGTWVHESGQAQIRFAACGEAICGRLVWIRAGAPTNARVGDQAFFAMKLVRPDLWQGKTLYPEDGKIYEASMRLEGTTLTTFGCALGGMICRSVRWTRVRRDAGTEGSERP